MMSLELFLGLPAPLTPIRLGQPAVTNGISHNDVGRTRLGVRRRPFSLTLIVGRLLYGIDAPRLPNAITQRHAVGIERPRPIPRLVVVEVC